jgi:hypothetical protein
MIIKFSRHARRRAKLYAIPESTIESILTNMKLTEGEHDLIENVEGFKYPIKIVVSVEDDILTIIANYPLKKGKNK